MSMRSIITIAVIWLMICCSLYACSDSAIEKESGAVTSCFSNTECGSEPIESTDTAIPLKFITFRELSWYGDNDRRTDVSSVLLTIYDVYETPNLFRVYLTIGDVASAFSDLKLAFRVSGKTENVTIRAVFPNMSYEILFNRHGSDGFDLIGATWDDSEVPILGSRKEFGGFVRLIGMNTLKYFAVNKNILVFDSRGCVINDLHLHGIGSTVLNQGASYYCEVIE